MHHAQCARALLVMLMSLEEVKSMLTDYVNNNSNVKGLHWDQHMSRELLLPFDPYAKTYDEMKDIAHYFLLVAAITETELVGRAENSRALMIHIHNFLGDDCFKRTQSDVFDEIIRESDVFDKLPISKDRIPKVLTSVNRFVQVVAEGDLIKYAARFEKPEEIVTKIADNIARMGGRYIEKAWMYMRWMTRGPPDLGILNNFSPRDLYVPMTSPVRNIAFCLGLCSESRSDEWGNFKRAEQDRKCLTEFAKELFPEDPAIVDYRFYILGRWIRGEQLSLELLKNHLQFWEKVYDRIQRAPVTFVTISRKESTFERSVKAELEKLRFMFSFEPFSLNLPRERGAPQYTPDFVLPRCKKKGRVVILEPHGFWTPLEKRQVRIGHRTFWIWVRPTRIDVDELEFVDKLRDFRNTWKEKYYLILIVPSTVKDRVKDDYLDMFDEIYEGRDIPRLLYNLKKHSN